jgi:hypothetical protein
MCLSGVLAQALLYWYTRSECIEWVPVNDDTLPTRFGQSRCAIFATMSHSHHAAVVRRKEEEPGRRTTGEHQSMKSSWIRPHYPLDFGTAVGSSCCRAEAGEEDEEGRPEHEEWKAEVQQRRKTSLDDDFLHETTITILSNDCYEEEDVVSSLPQHLDDRGMTVTEQDAAAGWSTQVETITTPPPWWIQFFHFVFNLIWYVLWNAIGGPTQSICRILILLLSTIVTSGMAPLFGSIMMSKGKSSSSSKKADHPKGTLLITTKEKKKKQQPHHLAKEITESTTSISESAAAAAAGASFILSIDVNQNDASPIDVDAQVDALLARRRKQKAPIQTIDVRSSKQVSYHGTTAVGSDHNDGGEHQLHRHLQKVLVVVVDTDDDIAEHEHDEEEMSVLTMDPTLLAISRREAEGHVLAPHRVAPPPHYLPPRMLMEPREYMVVDVDNDDDAASEDLSEIAPLDLVSL